MLENNHLYRRIQHKNLFKAFSRTYSRQTPLRKLHSENKNHTYDNTTYSNSTPFIHNNHTQYANTTKLGTIQNSARTLQLTAQTAPIFKRSENFHRIEAPYSSTVNMPILENQGSKLQKYPSNSYLSALLQKRKCSASSISNLTHNVRKQNFKLKSCSQAKQINYQGDIDETDFSILQFNKRYQIKKQLQQKQQRQIQAQAKIGLLKYRFKQGPMSQLKSNVGKRIAAHLFNRYNRTMEGFSDLKKKEDSKKLIENP